MIICKSAHEIELMKISGKIVADVLDMIGAHIRPGVTGVQLDAMAESYIEKCGARPSFKGYGGFPATICVSPNEVVVHGIPDNKPFEEGDIVSIDMGAVYKGFHTDAARTFPVGRIDEALQALVQTTKESFFRGIEYCRTGYRISDISHAIQRYVEERGYSVVRALTGHGVGTVLHEDPPIPNYGQPGRGPRIQEGMTLAIEPMVNIGGYSVRTLSDGLTALTSDGTPSAHYENTVAVINGEPVILTLNK